MKQLSKLKIIIKEFKRNINLEVNLQSNSMEDGEEKVPNIVMSEENYEEVTIYYWTAETFHNRSDLMNDVSLINEDDPLWVERIHSLSVIYIFII